MSKYLAGIIAIFGIALLSGCVSVHNIIPEKDRYLTFDCDELKKEISIIHGYHNEAVSEQGLTGKTAVNRLLFGSIGANINNEMAHTAADNAEKQKKILYEIYDEKKCDEKIYNAAKSTNLSPTQSSNKSPLPPNLPSLAKGTGFLYNSANIIVTNYHVVRASKLISIKLLNGQSIKAELVAKDVINDIALLRLDSMPDGDVGKIIFGDSSKIRIGDKTFTVGYPLSNILGSSPKYSEGVINALSGVGNDPKSFQISIPIQPGNSGGPLFNAKGEVVGMVTSSLDAQATSSAVGNLPQNVNFAIKSAFIQSLLSTISETLISPTSIIPVPVYQESNRSDFVRQIQNGIVLLEVER